MHKTKQASLLGRWSFNTPETSQAYYAHWGDQMQNSLINGSLAGGGAVGLYYLAKKLQQKRKEETSKKTPNLNDVANAPLVDSSVKLSFDLPTMKLPTVSADTLSRLKTPALGAGVGALIGALRAGKGKKLRGALGGGLVGGGVGALASSDAVKALMGRGLPERLPSIFGEDAGGPNYHSKSPAHGMYINLANIGMSGLGAAGGGYAAKKLLEDKKKKTTHTDMVANARDEYFKTLLGDEKVSSILDALYEKKAGTIFSDPNDLGDHGMAYNWLWKNPATAYLTAASLGALGGGAVGAKYMYDKTKRDSNAGVLEQAAAARKRLQSASSLWMDPVELAKIKELTSNKELAHARSM